MTNPYLKGALLTLVALFLFSCTTEESSSETTTSGGSSSTTRTTVNMTARTTDGNTKSGYQILMFDQPVSTNAALPPIILEVTTDSNGLAVFDLDGLVTGTTTKTYYFEAFTRTSNGDLVFKSITHPQLEISRNEIRTTSILVN